MSKTLKWLLVATIVGAASFGQVASADIENRATATNVQEGDNESDTEQEGRAKSGDAVAGQVVGVVGSGHASVDATNRSEDVDIETGDVEISNDSDSFVGLNAGTSTALGGGLLSDILNAAPVSNLQEGDNEYDLEQEIDAQSGDGVGGQVIGVVTTDPCGCGGGDVSIVAANTSLDVDIETGDVEAENDADAFVGLNATGTLDFGDAGLTDILNLATAANVQEGDNELEAEQDINAASGDGVGGQVLGVVAAGDASIDATNWSEDVEVETGDIEAENDFNAFVGLNAGTSTNFADGFLSDIFNAATVTNLHEGDNEKDLEQSLDTASGDAVAGQVVGVVTSAGGSADLVLASTSLDSETESGEIEGENDDDEFVGLNATGTIDLF